MRNIFVHYVLEEGFPNVVPAVVITLVVMSQLRGGPVQTCTWTSVVEEPLLCS